MQAMPFPPAPAVSALWATGATSIEPVSGGDAYVGRADIRLVGTADGGWEMEVRELFPDGAPGRVLAQAAGGAEAVLAALLGAAR